MILPVTQNKYLLNSNKPLSSPLKIWIHAIFLNLIYNLFVFFADIIAWVYLTAVAIFVVVVARTVCCYQKRKKLQHYREQAYYRMEEQLVKQTKKKKKAPQAEL